MNHIFKFIIILFFLVSCSSKEEEKISVLSDKEMEIQMIEAYEEGLRELEKGVDCLWKNGTIPKKLLPKSFLTTKNLLKKVNNLSAV